MLTPNSTETQGATPAEEETNLPEALRGLVDHRCPEHPVTKEKEADIVRSATSVPPCPQPTHTDPGATLCLGVPGLSMRLASDEVGTLDRGEAWAGHEQRGTVGQPHGREQPHTPPWWLRE